MNHRWYKFSLISGLIPLISGCLIFIAWLVTRADWLALAGAYTIMVGLVLFIFGLVFLALYWIHEWKEGKASPVKRSLVSLGILFLNFPVLVLILYVQDYISSTVTVRVINRSPIAITDMTLFEKDHMRVYPTIAPGQEVTEYFHFKFEGSIHYRLSVADSTKEGVVFGYVINGSGDSTIMVIRGNGVVEVGEPHAELKNKNQAKTLPSSSYVDWVLQSILQHKNILKHKEVQGVEL